MRLIFGGKASNAYNLNLGAALSLILWLVSFSAEFRFIDF